MTTTRFPRDDLILGCAPLGGLYHKPIPFLQVKDVIKSAVLRHNIHRLDTAPWYGTGKSETDIGNLIENDPKLIEQPIYIYTKVGRVIKRRDECLETDTRVEFGDTCYAIVPENKDFVPVHDYTAEGIRESATQSRQRLRIGVLTKTGSNESNPKHRIVSLRLHDAETDERFKEVTTKGGIKELVYEQCQRNDLNNGVCEPSLGMNSPEYILKILRTFIKSDEKSPQKIPFTSILMAGCWNLIDQSGLTVFEFCETNLNNNNTIHIHNAGIFGAGLLWGGKNYRYQKANKDAIEKRDRWLEVAKELNTSLPALAFAFAFLPTPVSKIVFGATSVRQLEGCVAAADEAAYKLLSNESALKQMILLGERKQLFDHGVAAKC